MAYCVQADLVEKMDDRILISLTDDDDSGAVDPGIVDEIIEETTQEIDSYVGMRYPIPLLPVPPIIRKKCIDMTVYNLYMRRREVPERIASNYKDCIAWLKLAGAGKVKIDALAIPAGETITAKEIDIESQTRVFKRDTMTGL